MMRRGRVRTCVAETQAQATVEMAVVAPVLIVLALIVYNVMVFAGAAARFDRIAPDIVLAKAVSPEGEGGAVGASSSASAVQAELEAAFEDYDVEIEVGAEGVSSGSTTALLTLVGNCVTYRCTLRMHPWPSGLSIAGVNLGAPALLQHTRTVVIDPWRPGVML